MHAVLLHYDPSLSTASGRSASRSGVFSFGRRLFIRRIIRETSLRDLFHIRSRIMPPIRPTTAMMTNTQKVFVDVIFVENKDAKKDPEMDSKKIEKLRKRFEGAPFSSSWSSDSVTSYTVNESTFPRRTVNDSVVFDDGAILEILL